MSELSQVVAAYLAGIVDGEGCIALYMPKRKTVKSQGGFTFLPQIQIANTDREWLEHIGKIAEVKYDIQSKSIASKKWKANSYTLRFPPESVRILLPQIYPYLFVKKINAEVLMFHFEHGPKREDSGKGKMRTDEKFDLSKYLVSIMHRLNMRGAGAKEIKEQAIREFREYKQSTLTF